MGQQEEERKKYKRERVTGLGRRTREEIVKWNQTTALRFDTGGRDQKSPASLRGKNGGRLRQLDEYLLAMSLH